MATESGTHVGDTAPIVQLVTTEPPEPVAKAALPEAPAATPTDQARDATIARTGADPPPEDRS